MSQDNLVFLPVNRAFPLSGPCANPGSGQRRRLLGLGLASLLLAACATDQGFTSGRLARITPADFTGYSPDQIAVGIDMDSRVPASLNRGPELVVAVLPVDHDTWEPIGARMVMRPISIIEDKPDKANGKALKAWGDSPPGRLRLTYVLTDDSRTELALLQQKFRDLLQKYPAGSGKGGALRIRADIYRMMPVNHSFGSSRIQTWLQLSVGEGPFVLWDGAIGEMR